jgi:aminopeptidase N
LGKYYKYNDLEKEIEAGLKDSSYQVNARAFKIISDKDPDKAFKVAVQLEADSSSDLFMELTSFYAAHPDKNYIPYFTKALRKSRGWYNYQILNNFGKYLATQNDPILSEGISFLENFASYSSRKRQMNAINNCYKAILTDIKSRIDKKEEELQNAEKNNSPLLNKVEIEKSLRDLKALKSKVSESQDKLDDARGK